MESEGCCLEPGFPISCLFLPPGQSMALGVWRVLSWVGQRAPGPSDQGPFPGPCQSLCGSQGGGCREGQVPRKSWPGRPSEESGGSRS